MGSIPSRPIKEGEDRLLVNKIKDGTVIDHIPAGKALTVLRILGADKPRGNRVAVVMNAESRKMGRKDIVKLEGIYPHREDLDKIALIAPEATINIIKDYTVKEKRRASIPKEINGILKCINPTCITRQEREHVKPRFKTISVEPLLIQCIYCSSLIRLRDIESLLIK
ncbi:MAG: aspartate carbamoyltransferase regulatory subunit [Desulfurococcales archaeon]|nr:aspartate carbamoyltransferase regulatory subunit [Desulfurococcales archaeon]